VGKRGKKLKSFSQGEDIVKVQAKVVSNEHCVDRKEWIPRQACRWSMTGDVDGIDGSSGSSSDMTTVIGSACRKRQSNRIEKDCVLEKDDACFLLKIENCLAGVAELFVSLSLNIAGWN
jgi:hypothetical protein